MLVLDTHVQAPSAHTQANGSEMARAFTRRISMGTISSYVMQTDSHQATHDVYGEGSCPKFCFAVQTLAFMTEFLSNRCKGDAEFMKAVIAKGFFTSKLLFQIVCRTMSIS